MSALPLSMLLHDDTDDEEAAAAFFGCVISRVQVAQEARTLHRHQHRLYLCRRELLPNPRDGTPWQRLWNSQEDRAFITTMGFDVQTFRRILEGPTGFGHRWESATTPRNDVSVSGDSRHHRRSLDGAGALGLILHYLGSAMLDVSLQQIFALTPTTLSRYLEFAETILLETLRSLPEARIAMPKTVEEFQALSDMICERHPLLPGAFGSIDGLSLPVQVSDDPEIENATYNGWKTSHHINNVIAFSPEGVITIAAINAPGSWHDANVARPIFEKLRTSVPEGFFLVADSAFPRGTAAIAGKIHAALKAGEHIPAECVAQDYVLSVNRQLLSYRQTAEWGMRMIQGSFGRLRVPLSINAPEQRNHLLEICFRLSNVRARCVGINQIQNVYMEIWRAAEDDELWLCLGDLLFSDIRKRDRVSRFHLVVVDEE